MIRATIIGDDVVIHHLADRVLVMHDGRIVESGSAEDVFAQPRHPYTQRLLASLQRAEPQIGIRLMWCLASELSNRLLAMNERRVEEGL